MSLGLFALRRLLWTIPVLLVVVTLLFGMMRAIGGDPLRSGQLPGLSNSTWNKTADPKPAAIERNLRRRFGLDRPWHVQYVQHIRRVVTFDFGPAIAFRDRTVNSILLRQGRVSLELGLLAFGWALALGLPLGLVSALRTGTGTDAAARTITALAYGLPNFLVGTLLVYVLAVRWRALPTSGWDSWSAKLLPSFTLGLLPAGYVARLLRASLLETMREDYVRAAVAKGLRRTRIVLVHVLPNSLVPVVTALGPLVGYLVTGSFVIEVVFNVPGIGRYYVSAVLARDYPLVLGLTTVLTFTIVIANLLVDVAHAALDPRVRDARAAG